MSEFDDIPANAQPDSWLVHQTVIAGILAASSRFVPIPFVDDLIRNRCRRYIVAKTLAAHGDPLSIDELRPFYGSQGGWLSGCAGMLVKAPLKLLLFPIRKIVTVLTSIRGVPMEIMRMVLLGRTLDRYLDDGRLTDSSQALAMRTAFDESFARMDFRAVRAALRDALKSVDGWKSSAIKGVRETLDRTDDAPDEIATSSSIEKSADQVQDVLQRPETLALFSEFDRRFDEAMKVA